MIEGRKEGEETRHGKERGQGEEKRKRDTVGVNMMRKKKRDIDTSDWEKR